MAYVSLLFVVAGVTLQNLWKKQFNERTRAQPEAAAAFNACMTATAFVFFLVLGLFQTTWHFGTALYAAAFGVCFFVACVFTLLAIEHGSLALTSLVVSYSLVLPALYGVCFLGEALTLPLCAGILMLMASLFLLNARRAREGVSARWAVYAALACLGNGGCSLTQKLQQLAYPGAHRVLFMIVGMSIACLFCASRLLPRAGKLRRAFRTALPYAAASGVVNALVNIIMLVLATSIPAVLLYPSVSAGGIAATYCVARFLYKEEISRMRKVGFLLGVLAIIIMNIP